jgi:hypothetical protein
MTRADRRKYHYIYKIVRVDGSGKYYIGMHSTDNINDGYFGSGSLLSRSIKKHGKESHTKEILEYLPSRKELKEREREIVNEELVGNSLCMNLRLGGNGGSWQHLNNNSDVQRAKGKKGNAKMQLLRETSPEWSDAFKLKMRTAIVEQYKNGTRKAPGWSESAKKASNSPEANEKRKQTIKKNGSNLGTKNSMYGKCWIVNEVHSIAIKIEELPSYISLGYTKGRKLKIK